MEKHYSLTETAALIRKTLKEIFPETKFSVRSDSYSGGSAIRISYTDGPLTRDVEAIVSLFEGRDYDSLTESTRYLAPRLYKGELVTFNYGYITVSRHVSETLLQIAAYRVHKETKLPLLEVRNGHLVNAEYQVNFIYLAPSDRLIPGLSQRVSGGEWYSQLVHQVSWNTAPPYKRGEAELPQIVDKRLDDIQTDSTAAVN